MFSSLATFLFGAQPTSESTPSQPSPVQSNPSESGNEQAAPGGDVIEVTSSTPSVAGNQRGPLRLSNSGKRGGAKNRRAKQRQLQQQQQHQQQQQQQQQGGQRKQPATLTKLLTPNGECVIEDDIDEDEWYIVEKEDEENDSLPRSDSEEELTVARAAAGAPAAAPAAAARRRQHINSHSLYSGPRPQQQRNYLQRTRAAGRTLSISTLSPPRTVPANELGSDTSAVSQSLYAPVAAAAVSPSGSDSSSSSGSSGAGLLMEESCMSVYHSIRSSQAGTESFVNLDLGSAAVPEPEPEPAQPAAAVQQPRSHSARFDRHAAAELKQQTLARQSQKSHNKKQHQQLCRSAIKRANKVRDFQAKGQRPRRSDMQHCKLVSGANNNRKCC
ncbi:PREDICTED: hormone receptor 4 isoform X2 [Drosophila arizonae]|uniref:Hormone receptor 4 isoform X2 n=1 Tax=Drosophila arizonae TaxID=7263 RepID=A0ABM1PA49_DROAR|nr:PREDICTED: hormone receptor 4 isoform X2 [Drosophila arizonae]